MEYSKQYFSVQKKTNIDRLTLNDGTVIEIHQPLLQLNKK